MVMDPQAIGEDLPAVLKKFAIQPLPTLYGGVSYRSRTEARWAVFFKTLGIQAHYEAEGYDLNGTWYLPDFWLPELKIFVEIKGEEPNEEEMQKAVLLAEGSERPVFVFFGMVDEVVGEWIPPQAYVAYPLTGVDDQMRWCECPDCGSIGIQWNGFSDRLPCKQGILSAQGIVADKAGCPRHSANKDRAPNYRSAKLNKAYQAFRGVRFGR